MARRLWPVLALLGEAACSNEGAMRNTEAYDSASSPPSSPDFALTYQSVRVNVYPSLPAQADVTVLPQTFEVDMVQGPDQDLGILTLDPSGALLGTIVGYKPNPMIATLPGQDVPVGGDVFVERAGTVELYKVDVSETGTYELDVTRPGVYDVTVVPEDPLLPIHTSRLELNTDPPKLPANVEEGDVDIGLGVPIYGIVTANGAPVPNTRVHVVDELGHESATVRTDEQGRYLVRVQPDRPFTVVSEGSRGLHPVWRRRRIAHPSHGAVVDFPYPNDLDLQGVATAEIVASVPGASVGGSRIRFVSESLEGFDDLLEAGDDVSWSWEETVDNRGIVTARVVPGTYRVEVLPPAAERTLDDLSPALVVSPYVDVGVRLPGALGELRLLDTLSVTRTVLDSDGLPVQNAQVTCEEDGFGGRSVEASTDEAGTFVADLPRVPLRCEIVPPQNERGRAVLAIRHITTQGPELLPANLVLSPGVLFQGRVMGPAQSVAAFAWVEIRDAATDELLTYGLTDDGGELWLRADLTPTE